MKKALVVLLIMVMILIGLPLPVMGAMGCADCAVMGTPAVWCAAAVVLVATAAVLLALARGRRLSSWLSALADLVAGAALFRPPRLA